MGPETHTRTNDPLAPSHDVLALIADVERTIGTLRERAGGEVQRAGEEAARLAREVESLENERSTLLGRQMTLAAELATERGARDADRSDFASRLASAERAGAQAVAEAEARLAAAEQRFQSAVQAATEGRAGIEEELATARERVQMLDERLVEAENAIAGDRARVKTVERRAAEERAALVARIAELESQLAAATVAHDEDLEEAALEFANDHAELEESIESLRAELEARTQELAQARAQAAEAQTTSTEASAQFEEFAREHDARAQALAQSEAARRSGEDCIRDLREHVAFREARIAQLDEALDACRTRIAALESEVAARTGEAAELARKVAALGQSAQPRNAPASDAEIEARARALAESQATAILAAKSEQLALAANFMRHRHQRLVNLHKGIKAKARRVRAEQAAFDAARAAAPHAAAVAADGFAFPGHEGPVTSFDETRVAAERSALARERKEIAELRAVLASSEEMLARRATGMSSIGTAAASICFLALAALASWHVAGVVEQPPARASMEFAVTRQGPEGRPAAADATELAAWLKSEIGNAGFVGLVASRLNERGRSHAESSALVADLAQRLQIEPQGVGTVRLAMRGADAESAAATVDAVMSTVIYQANRDPARAGDGLRIGHANASNSAGGIPQPRIETLPDPARLARSGLVFGVLGAVGMAAGFIRYRAGRRALHGLA